jgi:hypothetical protein
MQQRFVSYQGEPRIELEKPYLVMLAGAATRDPLCMKPPLKWGRFREDG